jgi:general secretion pathway protein G
MWLELAVAFALIALFAALLLQRMHYYQEAAERARIELEVTKLKVALQARIGAHIAEHRAVNYAAMARENPVGWLDQPMAGYRGEPGPAEAGLLPPGSWYFDREAAVLVYLPLRHANLAPDQSGRKRLRFRIRVVRAEAGPRKDDAAVVGLKLTPVEPFKWF